MAQLNKFEVDRSWQYIEVRSNKGDVGVYKINLVNGECYIKTLVGDGNEADWKNCNINPKSLLTMNHRFLEEDEINKPLLSKPAPQPQPIVTPPASKIDFESVPPFAKPKKKVE